MPASEPFDIWTILGQERVRWCAKKDGKMMGSWLDKGESLTALNDRGWDCYVVLNPTRPDFCGIKPSDSDILHHEWILFDFDPIIPSIESSAGDHTQYIKPAYAVVEHFWPYTTATHQEHMSVFIMGTGRGGQAWVRMHQVPVHVGVNQARAMLAVAPELDPELNLKLDRCTSDASRLARFPKTINWKTGIRGSVVYPARPPLAFSREGLPSYSPPEQPVVHTNLTKLSELAPRLTYRASRFLFEGVDEERHKSAHAAACSLRDCGLPQEIAEEYVVQGADLCRPRLSPEEAKHCVRTAYRKQRPEIC